MRAFVASMIIFALMIAGGTASDIYLYSVADSVGKYADVAQNAAVAENYSELSAVCAELDAYWEANSFPLAVLIDHTHTGEVSRSLAELKTAVAAYDLQESSLALARIRQTVQNTAENEHFYLKNIF